MKNFFKILALVVTSAFFNSCDEYEAGSEISSPLAYGFERAAISVEVEEIDPNFALKVYSSQVVNYDRTVMFEIDPSSTALTSDYVAFSTNSIVIPAGSNFGSVDIEFIPSSLSLSATRTLKFNIIQPEDATAVALTTASTTISYKAKCVNNLVELSLVLDRWGSETSWEISKDGLVVASGGPFTDGATNALQAERKTVLCLEDGDYVFTIFDSYGDGMFTNASVIGNYQISSNGTVVLSRQFWGNGASNLFSRSHNFSL